LNRIILALSAFLLLTSTGCGPKLIPGLEIELADTPDQRQLIKVMEDFRASYERKDVDGLVALASKRFFEKSGSTDTEDDYAYDGLHKHFSEHFKMIEKIALDYTLKDVRVEGENATIDYHFKTRYLMKLPSGDKWQVTNDLNRMTLAKEDDQWKVLSGM
jgi:hypothetical protein